MFYIIICILNMLHVIIMNAESGKTGYGHHQRLRPCPECHAVLSADVVQDKLHHGCRLLLFNYLKYFSMVFTHASVCFSAGSSKDYIVRGLNLQ